MTHYDIFNILYPLWHYYDTIIAIITFTKVGLLLHIMTKSGKTLLFHLWQIYYCHYNFSTLLLLLLLLWHNYGHYGYLKKLWHLWQTGFIIVIILMGNYYLHYSYYHKKNNWYNSNNSNNSNNIFLRKSTSESGEKGSDSGFNRRKAFLHRTGSYCCKNIVIARWCVHLLFGLHPPETGVKHRVCPPAGQRHGRCGAAYSAQRVYWRCTAGRTKWNRCSTASAGDSTAQTWWCRVFTWNLSPRGFARSNP